MDRRKFITAGGVIATAMAIPAYAHISDTSAKRIKAILFDGFPIFNPTGVYKLAVQFFPEKGNELVKEWKTKQFEYTWLRTLSGSYIDFLKVIEDALVYAAAATGTLMNEDQQKQLVNAWYQLEVWPEVPGVLQQLKDAGYRLGVLSNFTPQMLNVNVENHHLSSFFEHLISVDSVKKYKPAPEAYQLGMKVFNLKKEEILFVPFAGWDAAGSKQFGYETFWINRLQTPPEKLSVIPDGSGKDLNDLLFQLKKKSL